MVLKRLIKILHFRPEPVKKLDKYQSVTISHHSSITSPANSPELFHYICFVPINNRLYELDGLQPYPIDHGPIIEQNGDWTDKFRQVIQERINLNTTTTANGSNSSFSSSYYSNQTVLSSNNVNAMNNNEIRYNLMALVPDRIKQNENYLSILCKNKMKLLNVIENKDQM